MYVYNVLDKHKISQQDFLSIKQVIHETNKVFSSHYHVNHLIQVARHILVAREMSKTFGQPGEIVGVFFVLYGHSPLVGNHYNLSGLYIKPDHNNEYISASLFCALSPLLEQDKPYLPVNKVCFAFEDNTHKWMKYLPQIGEKFQFVIEPWFFDALGTFTQLTCQVDDFIARADYLNEHWESAYRTIWTPRLVSEEGNLEANSIFSKGKKYTPLFCTQAAIEPGIEEVSVATERNTELAQDPTHEQDIKSLDANGIDFLDMSSLIGGI